MACAMGEADLFESLQGSDPTIAGAGMGKAQWQLDLIHHSQLGKQTRLGSHPSKTSLFRRKAGDVASIGLDLAAGRPLKSRNDAEQGGFARPGRTGDDASGAGRHVEADVGQGFDMAQTTGDMMEPKERRGRGHGHCCGRRFDPIRATKNPCRVTAGVDEPSSIRTCR
ncbi:MAG: hypothetical protein WCR07_11055 [Verrucomicrobiota bacterium]